MPQNLISKLLGYSPVKPLQSHMETVESCVRELVPLFEAALAGDFEAVAAHQQRVTDLEHEADAKKKEIRSHLPQRDIFLAVSRRDLLDTLTMQDNIANKAKDIAGLVLGRKMLLPAAMAECFLAYLRRSSEAVSQARKAINELDELVETGFYGEELARVHRILDELDDIESETDKQQVRVRSTLFDLEKDLPPVDAMFLYQLIDWIGDLGDLAQRVGSRLNLMLAR